ncbi:MAG: hypothetical protein DCC88_12300 [Spirobacillus cienkowskii]|jgi:hypothetical protein|uniref:Uncharacterized protein n=1 Tax=Spirobacillus cienkowskii TaxID=495820 RepID=A0A369KV75_9BACT|nr:MAG: hypothetical protein DCC88_12300 [Spirobacillus cienkowskii]
MVSFCITDDKFLEGKIDIVLFEVKNSTILNYSYRFDNTKTVKKIITPFYEIKNSIFDYYNTRVKKNFFHNYDNCFKDHF